MTELWTRIKPHLHQTLFTLLMISFIGILLLDTVDLKWAPKAIPLIVGLITFVMLVVQLVRDVVQRRAVRSAEEEDSVIQSLVEDVQRNTSVGEVVFDDDEVEADPRLIVIFGLWAVLFVLVAGLVSFQVAVPLGLAVILWHATRSWKLTLFVTVGVTALLWVVFAYFLEVQF